nr:TonB-dependent receptor [Pedobacter sp. V48]
MKGLKDKIQNLKIRASWGKVGNNNMSPDDDKGNYDYLATYNKINYSFNNASATGLAVTKIGNPLLVWESSTLANIGIEATALNGRLNVELDVYDKKTEDILTTPPIPLTAGTAAAPTQNTANMSNKGIEVSLGWKDKVGEFSYLVSGNFAYNYNRVTNYRGNLSEGYVTDATGARVYSSNIGQVSSGGDTRIIDGRIMNEYYLLTPHKGSGAYKNSDGTVNINGGPKDGMIRTPADLDWVNSMIAAGYKFQPVGTVGKGQLYYGDLIYSDVNGDGIYGNSFDKQFANVSTEPKYTFGLNLAASYKGFDFSMLWAASTGMNYLYNQAGINNTVTRLGTGIGTNIADNSYYYNEANPGDPANRINGSLPRLKWLSDSQSNIASTFWLYNASYLKLKNVQLGYTFAQGLIQKIGLSKLRVYVSGENLFMVTNYPGLDPEAGINLSYPTMKQFAAGLMATF